MTTLQNRLAHGAAVALLAGLAGCSASHQTATGAIPPEANTYQSGAQPDIKVIVFRGAPANPTILASDGAGGEWFAECHSTIAKIDEKSHKYSQFTSSFAKTSCGGGVGLGRNRGGMWFTDPIDNKLGFIWLKSHSFDVYKIPTPNAFPAAITAGPDNAMWFTEQGTNGSGKIGRVNLSVHPYKITELLKMGQCPWAMAMHGPPHQYPRHNVSIHGPILMVQQRNGGALGTRLGGRRGARTRFSPRSHHQRPARSCSPGATARVHGAQPIERKPRSCSGLQGTPPSRTKATTRSRFQSNSGFTLIIR